MTTKLDKVLIDILCKCNQCNVQKVEGSRNIDQALSINF